MSTTLTIARRYRGPPDSGNGGYVCGLLAAAVPGAAEVTLRSPPPLDLALEVSREGALSRLLAAGVLVAEARPTSLDLEVPAAPGLAEAAAATRGFPWWTGHPYPSCFVCGPDRAPGDGLCIHPGTVAGRALVAAPFTVDSSLVDEVGLLRPEHAWAALDCPSWFGFQCTQPFEGGPVLLGRLAARLDRRPSTGEACVCSGWFLGREGRKIHCASALHSAEGALLAVARATWVVLR